MNTFGSAIAGLMALSGFVLFFWLLGKHNALAKHKQFGAIRAIASGVYGPQSKKVFVLALALMGFGACGSMMGVAGRDAARRRACVSACTKQGFAQGKIGPSAASDPKNAKRAAFVACTCTGNPEGTSLELHADALPQE